MSDDFTSLGGWQSFKTGEWLPRLLQRAFRSYWTAANVDYFRQKYPKDDEARLARRMISLAAKNTAAIGAGTGAAISTDEIVTFFTAAEGGVGLPANIAIAAACLGTEIVSVMRFQLKLIADLGQLYSVPLDLEDPEDVWAIIAYAIGGRGSEMAGIFGAKVGGNLGRNGAKSIFSKETLKLTQAISKRLIGRKILQKTIMNYAVPVASIGVGASWNYLSTRSIGKIAQKHFIARQSLVISGDVVLG